MCLPKDHTALDEAAITRFCVVDLPIMLLVDLYDYLMFCGSYLFVLERTLFQMFVSMTTLFTMTCRL